MHSTRAADSSLTNRKGRVADNPPGTRTNGASMSAHWPGLFAN